MTVKTRAPAAASAQSIDRNSMQRRLEDATRLFEQALTLTPDGKKKILKERAKKLAREPKVNLGTKVDILEFVLAYERYAIE